MDSSNSNDANDANDGQTPPQIPKLPTRVAILEAKVAELEHVLFATDLIVMGFLSGAIKPGLGTGQFDNRAVLDVFSVEEPTSDGEGRAAAEPEAPPPAVQPTSVEAMQVLLFPEGHELH